MEIINAFGHLVFLTMLSVCVLVFSTLNTRMYFMSWKAAYQLEWPFLTHFHPWFLTVWKQNYTNELCKNTTNELKHNLDASTNQIALNFKLKLYIEIICKICDNNVPNWSLIFVSWLPLSRYISLCSLMYTSVMYTKNWRVVLYTYRI